MNRLSVKLASLSFGVILIGSISLYALPKSYTNKIKYFVFGSLSHEYAVDEWGLKVLKCARRLDSEALKKKDWDTLEDDGSGISDNEMNCINDLESKGMEDPRDDYERKSNNLGKHQEEYNSTEVNIINPIKEIKKYRILLSECIRNVPYGKTSKENKQQCVKDLESKGVKDPRTKE